MVDLLSLAPEAARVALAQWLGEHGEPAYRAKKILARFWERPLGSWGDPTQLPPALRRGLGEPLLNRGAVDGALPILNHAEGFGIGARHITVSTVGILPNLAKLAQRPEQFRLALSLHAPTPTLRHELMPIEKKYTLPAVIAALTRFRRRGTPEDVLIGGKKDAPQQAGQPAQGARPPGAPLNLPPLPPPRGAEPSPRPP